MQIRTLLEVDASTQLDLMVHNGVINTEEVFSLPLQLENYFDITPPPKQCLKPETVSLYDLHPIQEDVEPDHVRAYLDGRGRSGNAPILVCRDEGGNLLLQDGHHRVIAALLEGKSSLPALVATVQSIDADEDHNMIIHYVGE